MPILNTISANYTKSMISIPSGGIWQSPEQVITSSFNISHSTNIAADTSYKRGTPYVHAWSIDDDAWRISFSTPFLLYDTGATNSGIKSGFDILSNFLDHIYNVIVVSSYPTGFYDLWLNDNNYVVESLSVNVNQNDARLNVNILSTCDPRNNFYQQGDNNIFSDEQTSPGFLTFGARLCKPFDFIIPVSGMASGMIRNCIGGPLHIYEEITETGAIYKLVPAFAATGEIITDKSNSTMSHISLLTNFTVNVNCGIERLYSVGIPSQKPILAISSISCEGEISYIPLVRTSETGTEDEYLFAAKLPHGWKIDTQIIDKIRSGGRLYIQGNPPYTGDNSPLWVGLALKLSTPATGTATGYYQSDTFEGYKNIIDSDILGPVMVSSYDLSISPNNPINVNVRFKTNLGCSATMLGLCSEPIS